MIRLFERILMFLFASNLTFFSNLTNCTPNSSHFFPFLFFCRDDDTLDVEFSDYEGDYGSSQPDYGITSNYRLIIFRGVFFYHSIKEFERIFYMTVFLFRIMSQIFFDTICSKWAFSRLLTCKYIKYIEENLGLTFSLLDNRSR